MLSKLFRKNDGSGKDLFLQSHLDHMAHLADEIGYALEQPDFIRGTDDSALIVAPMVRELESMMMDVYSRGKNSPEVLWKPAAESAASVIREYYRA